MHMHYKLNPMAYLHHCNQNHYHQDFTTPTGWLGMLVGAALWHPIFGATAGTTETTEEEGGGAMAAKVSDMIAAL